MTYASLDSYGRSNRLPRDAKALDRHLAQRSADSILSNGARFALWSISPDRSSSPLVEGVAELTRAEEVPTLAEALRSGPVPLGLVRAKNLGEIGRNHQVVAYAIHQEGSVVSIWVYDSCQPKADDVRLVLDLADPDAPITEYAGTWVIAEWRGLFVERYAPTGPSK
ncbi:MAG TPA: hypothetical protein VLA05_08115 [Coriobacteriia bacterium]|nr:hypothetical protein [Coriobacteriia bacterium]